MCLSSQLDNEVEFLFKVPGLPKGHRLKMIFDKGKEDALNRPVLGFAVVEDERFVTDEDPELPTLSAESFREDCVLVNLGSAVEEMEEIVAKQLQEELESTPFDIADAISSARNRLLGVRFEEEDGDDEEVQTEA